VIEGQGFGMYRYAIRRTTRNKKLFLAILVGVTIATSLFATSNIGANSLVSAMLQDVLDSVTVDMYWNTWSWGEIPTGLDFYQLRQDIESFDHVDYAETVIRHWNRSWAEEQYRLTYGIQKNSSIYNGITLVAGNLTLGANETLIATSSARIGDYPIGSNYSITVPIWTDTADNLEYNLTLKVVGHIELDENALQVLMVGVWLGFWGYQYETYLQEHVSFFLVDIESTFLPIYDWAETQPEAQEVELNAFTLVYLDRAALINPYNIQYSIQNIQQLSYQLQNYLYQRYNGDLINDLANALQAFNYISENFRMTFLQVSIPVFFIALYMGISLNDVSYSIRRREVGLLLTKGVTRGTITSLFVWEAILTGVFASILGILIAIWIIPFFIPTITWVAIFTMGIGLDTIFLTIMFGVLLAVLTSYLPARKASKILTTEAIREYTLAGESTGYPRLLAWSALILGAYKLIIWLLGINVAELAINLIFTNPILGSLAMYWVVFDTVIAFWAPLLFLWGFVTIIVKGWKGFYHYSERFIGRIMGDLGGLASHNISRRPGRTVAIIFITALIIGYSVQTIGVLTSSNDLALRDAYTSVGADIKVLVSYPENVSDLLPIIRDIDGVRDAAGEYTFTMSTVFQGGLTVRAINVSEWMGVAYLELGWILGVPISTAFESIASNNETIILQKLVASEMSLTLGQTISVEFSSLGGYHPLSIVGFMGPEPAYYQSPYGMESMWLAESTWSYVSVELMESYSSEISPRGYILISLASPSLNMDVIQALEALDGVLNVDSAISRIEEYNTSILQNAGTNMMQLGVAFAIILASIGTLVIIYLTLRERRTTTALMSARGMKYSQTVNILSAEILTMMIFAILLGFSVGLIIYYGLVSGGVSASMPMLLTVRFLPPEFAGLFGLFIGTIIGLLIMNTLIPILIEARSARYDLSVLR
jgi:ABC-type antimicrobial peptide transport system permease subunit